MRNALCGRNCAQSSIFNTRGARSCLDLSCLYVQTASMAWMSGAARRLGSAPVTAVLIPASAAIVRVCACASLAGCASPRTARQGGKEEKPPKAKKTQKKEAKEHRGTHEERAMRQRTGGRQGGGNRKGTAGYGLVLSGSATGPSAAALCSWPAGNRAHRELPREIVLLLGAAPAAQLNNEPTHS